MGVECAALKTWFKSIQSKIGKITDTKSGSATKTLTDRGKYMDHIVRQPSRVALSLKSRLQPPPPTTSSVAEPLESEHTDSDDDTAQPARRGSQPTDPCDIDLITMPPKGGRKAPGKKIVRRSVPPETEPVYI